MLKSNLAIISGIIGLSKSKSVDTSNGKKAVLRMSIDHTDEYEKTHRFFVECWEDLAKKASSFAKGTHVLVESKLIMDKWEKTEGNKTLVLLKASDVKELPKNSGHFRINAVVYSGNLTQEPVLKPVKTDQDNKTVSRMTICQNDYTKKAHYVAVESWNKLAETTKRLNKGTLVEARGKLIQNTWGENQSQVLMVANEIDFISTKK